MELKLLRLLKSQGKGVIGLPRVVHLRSHKLGTTTIFRRFMFFKVEARAREWKLNDAALRLSRPHCPAIAKDWVLKSSCSRHTSG
nr:hypothetical protein Iba_chr08cCG11080 [Ipomoea batatas]